jgi:hypothetical protein
MDEAVKKALAEEVAKVLPQDLILGVIGAVVERAIDTCTWGQNPIEALVKDAVVERARELLRTKYKEQLDKQAEGLALKMVGEVMRMRLAER